MIQLLVAQAMRGWMKFSRAMYVWLPIVSSGSWVQGISFSPAKFQENPQPSIQDEFLKFKKNDDYDDNNNNRNIHDSVTRRSGAQEKWWTGLKIGSVVVFS